MFITIKTDGTVNIESFKLNKNGNPDMMAFFDKVREIVDGDQERVKCFYLEEHSIKNVNMLVNENAALIGGYSYNPIASVLFGVREHGKVIYGDVCLVWTPYNSVTKNNVLMPFDAEQIYQLQKIIHNIKEEKELEDVWRLKNGLQREI